MTTDKIVPIDPRVPAWLAGFNKLHDESYIPHRTHRLTESQGMAAVETSEFTAMLREVADIMDRHPDDIMVQIDVHCFLREAWFMQPHVTGWLVVKHYYNRPGDHIWKPATWIACTTREQAEAFAPAIQEHYAKKAHNLALIDTFKVELGKARPLDFIDPNCEVHEYIGRLAR